MKASDLMIGDFVTFKDCQNDEVKPIVKIWQLNEDNEAFVFIDSNDALEEIEIDDEIVGIPLTSEILEKNGWKYDHIIESYQLKDNAFYTSIDLEGKTRIYVMNDYIFGMALGFVHELQHALRLCGISQDIIV